MKILIELKMVWFSLLQFLDYPDFFAFRQICKQVLQWDIHCATVNHWHISIHDCPTFLEVAHPRSFSVFRFITPNLRLFIYLKEEQEELERRGILSCGDILDDLQKLSYRVKRDPNTQKYTFCIVEAETKNIRPPYVASHPIQIAMNMIVDTDYCFKKNFRRKLIHSVKKTIAPLFDLDSKEHSTFCVHFDTQSDRFQISCLKSTFSVTTTQELIEMTRKGKDLAIPIRILLADSIKNVYNFLASLTRRYKMIPIEEIAVQAEDFECESQMLTFPFIKRIVIRENVDLPISQSIEFLKKMQLFFPKAKVEWNVVKPLLMNKCPLFLTDPMIEKIVSTEWENSSLQDWLQLSIENRNCFARKMETYKDGHLTSIFEIKTSLDQCMKQKDMEQWEGRSDVPFSSLKDIFVGRRKYVWWIDQEGLHFSNTGKEILYETYYKDKIK